LVHPLPSSHLYQCIKWLLLKRSCLFFTTEIRLNYFRRLFLNLHGLHCSWCYDAFWISRNFSHTVSEIWHDQSSSIKKSTVSVFNCTNWSYGLITRFK
jgi:hypothetical protein